MAAPFAEKLLNWYRDHRADRPWRRDPKAYHTWLSEIMLQQTRVDTVIPYYRRFVQAFPTIESLAAAPLAEVLKLWEGLGYYSRARNLHRAAQIVMDEYGGALPADVETLLKLPGIGNYTAGAIASIAFGIAAPVLDGNVMRLFARLLDMSDDINQPATRNKLWRVAEYWLPAHAPGDYNQALMELGQQVCRPRNPLCARCPIQSHCRAWKAGAQNARPVRSQRSPTPHYDVTAGLIRDERESLLIARRPLDGLLGGLWEFPGGKVEAGEPLIDCLKRELREELAIAVEVGALFAVVDHAFTHFKITLHAFDCRYLGALPPHIEPQTIGVMDWAWVTEAQLPDYSFGKADRVVIAELARRREMLL
ncbi:MAG: A/G-specific adenine glycosylase [Chloroflexota bacterium]|nr:A/G-specific adenine glycosylase [Chloroflexota bacterium]